jgi:diguanylate cyclase (GGDEF)-like protein/putative nucleotidyltransferase with HDIG domain
MAIDAKDQITHGHIRRVQAYAIGLARSVGVTDDKLIKAIEAAALLHDTGKLAVPEYILNKPGKLTPAEFEKMKLHASLGADILSAITFPYPVVPIVRHHHENWDGTGYPDGLKGPDIPIGARILSVVDCFDALTSDRPYRPRLSEEDALRILADRRGTMYDPLIIDAFARVHQEIAREAVVPAPRPLDMTSSASPRLDEITASADEMLTLYELARALAGQASVGDTSDVLAKHLRRLIPSSLCVFYSYDALASELVASHALGDASSVVAGMRIPLGQRLSGWVATNRHTIVNSDPTLDLGEVARQVTPRLRSCLSTPLVCDDTLVGVLTLYSVLVNGFSEDHRRIIEVVARQVAQTLKRAAEFDSSRRDAITGLPNLTWFRQLVESASVEHITPASALMLLFVDIVGLRQINLLYGRPAGDDVLNHVVRHTRAALRAADMLFRHGGDELVALLDNADAHAGADIARRIRQTIRDRACPLDTGESITVDVAVTCVCAPRDGDSLASLIGAAQSRSGSHSTDAKGPSIH